LTLFLLILFRLSVACFYFVDNNFEQSIRFFRFYSISYSLFIYFLKRKITTSESQDGHGWMGLGTVLAAQREIEQATAAFRMAARIFPGYVVVIFIIFIIFCIVVL